MRKKKKSLPKRWIDYLKDNPKGYWFKQKLYGWGWVPVSWQGWTVTSIFILYILGIANEVELTQNTNLFIAKLAIAIIILIIICYQKGENPRWRWGLDS